MFLLRFLALSALLCCGLRASAQPLETPPRLETGRLGMPAVAVGSAIYVIGGLGPSGTRSDVERIETSGQTPVVSTLKPTLLPRYFHTAEASGPFIYIMGGVSPQGEGAVWPQTFERLDTRDLSVKLLAPLPIGLRMAASVVVDGKIYLAGGGDKDDNWTNGLLIYDIANDLWSSAAPMPEHKECDLLPFRGGLLAVGGFDGKSAVRSVHFYDIAKNLWSELPLSPIKTSAHHGAVMGDNVILFGDFEDLGRVQSGNPIAGDWTLVQKSGFNPRRHSAVVTLGEKIYVIGGNIASSGSFYADIQVFLARKFAS